MSNPSKHKGTAAETAIVRYLRGVGFPGADRQPLRGNRDCGDLVICPGVVAEVKNYAAPAATGQAPISLLTGWLNQCDTEKANAGAELCPLLVKRAGTAYPGHWWAYLRVGDFAELLGAPESPRPVSLAPVCLSLASLVALLRAAGYGTVPEPATLADYAEKRP